MRERDSACGTAMGARSALARSLGKSTRNGRNGQVT